MTKRNKKMNEDIDLEILPNGQIKFCRKNKYHNDALVEILKSLVENDDLIKNNIKEFFSQSEDIKILIGDRFFCG